MEKNYSFPALVDRIFEDLLRFSNAELSCKTISSVRNSGITSAVKLNAVNDCPSAGDYRNFLHNLGLATLDRFMDLQKEMELPARFMLFDLALKRCHRLSSAVVAITENNNAAHPSQAWMFRHAVVTIDGQNCIDTEICDLILRLSHRHATIWHLMMKNLHDRLYCLSCIAGYTLPLISPNQPPSTRYKIKPCCTVAIAAALTRILYENGVFRDYNKSELCRQVASLISTPNQVEVSAKSFKNLFDDPDPQTLMRLETEFGKWMKISEDLREDK